jgi:antitoxin MazE
MKTTTIQKWGNSYAVRIPRDAVESMSFTEGQPVHIEAAVDGKTLTITPSTQASLSLESLLSRITPQNKHTETDWGDIVGKEVW